MASDHTRNYTPESSLRDELANLHDAHSSLQRTSAQTITPQKPQIILTHRQVGYLHMLGSMKVKLLK